MEALAFSASPQARRLRIGVWADSRRQPRWIAEALARLAASGFAELHVVQAGKEDAPSEGEVAEALAPLAAADSVPAGLERAGVHTSALWDLYCRVDRRLFGGAHSDPVDLYDVLQPGSATALDVAFVLGALDDAALDGLARYGVWRFCFGAHGDDDEAAAGAREAVAREPLTASGLKVRLSAGEPSRLAFQTWSRTESFSVARNRDHLCKTGELLERALRELHSSGPGWLQSCRALPLSTAAAGAPQPGALDALKLGTRLLRRGAEKALGVEQWFIAFAFGRSLDPALRGYTRLMPPKDRDWADPFPLEHKGRHYIFFEEVPFATRKGHIAVVEVDRAGRTSAPRVVLSRDYHLSYPFLFEHEGALFMIPESSRNRTVELWRCVDFPGEWKLERTLLEGVRLVDATLHCSGDRWWMFANCAPGASRIFDDELCLFSAERPTGDWRPHPGNPVKSDPRSSRPAGRLFHRDGALFRPAQVCVPRYGAGLALHQVLRLSPHEYAERQVERLVPPPESGLIGLHTMNQAGDLLVVDAFARRARFF